MTKPRRVSLAVLLLAMALPAAGASLAGDRLAPYDTGVQFAHLHSDIVPDPDVRFGRLPNGLTYVIKHNAVPAGGATVQMRIASGYLMEAEDERGLSFLLSRLAFDGDKNLKGQTLDDYLKAHDLQMSMTNGVTVNPDTTKYQMDLRGAAATDIDTGLFALREIADGLTLPGDAVKQEAATAAQRYAMSEGNVAYQAWTASNAKLYAGQAYANRELLGLPDVLLYSPPEKLAAFYAAHYRPELTTIILAGDFDPDMAEKRIKAAFGSWKPTVKSPPPAADFGVYQPKGPSVQSLTQPGLPEGALISWLAPFDDSYQTNAQVLDQTLNQVAILILNARLARAASDPTSPLTMAELSRASTPKTAEQMTLFVRAKPGQEEAAIKLALTYVEQLKAHGVSQDEIDDACNQMSQTIGAYRDRSAKQDDSDLAQFLSINLDNNAVINSAEQDVDHLEANKPFLTREAVAGAIKRLWSWDGPAFQLLGGAYGKLNSDAILADYRAVAAATPPKPEEVSHAAWAFDNFGPPAQPVKTETVGDTGITHLTYANGLNVYIERRTDTQNAIAVRLDIAGGVQKFPLQNPPPLFITTVPGFLEGSIGPMIHDDVVRVMKNKMLSMNFSIDESATVLQGSTNRDGLETQIQLMMAYATNYHLTQGEFERATAGFDDYYTRVGGTAEGVMSGLATRTLRSNDPRFGPPGQEQAARLTLADAQGVFDTALAPAPMTVTIVGDVDPAAAQAIVDKTFGTLKPLPAKANLPAGADHIAFPGKAMDKTLYFQAKGEQAIGLLTWPAFDYLSDLKRSEAFKLMTRVLNQRFYNLHAKDYGMSDPTFFSNYFSIGFKGYGYLSAMTYVPAHADDTPVVNAVRDAFADMIAHPITQAELDKARTWASHQQQNTAQDNAYWAEVIASGATPADIAMLQHYDATLTAVDLKQVQDLANTYLKMDKTVHLNIEPLPLDRANAS